MSSRNKTQLKATGIILWFIVTMIITCCEPTSESNGPVFVWLAIIGINMTGIMYSINKMEQNDDSTD